MGSCVYYMSKHTLSFKEKRGNTNAGGAVLVALEAAAFIGVAQKTNKNLIGCFSYCVTLHCANKMRESLLSCMKY